MIMLFEGAALEYSRLRPAQRRTLSEEVVDRLLELIAEGSSPTHRLPPEHVLCERLEVSRSALREALSALSHLGVIHTRGKARIASTVAARAQMLTAAYSSAPERELVQHALEARSLLEPAIAGLAAQRATPQALDEIQHFLHLMEQTPDGGDLIVEYDSGFHVAIARATGNPTLVHVISAVADALSSTRNLSLHAPGGTKRSIAGHHAIVRALLARDPLRARQAMQEHLDDVADLIHRILSQPGEGQ